VIDVRLQIGMQRTLHIDAEDECRPGHADEEDIQTRDHTKPEMHLKQRTAKEHGLWTVDKRQDAQSSDSKRRGF